MKHARNGQSWRTRATALGLGAWALVGLTTQGALAATQSRVWTVGASGQFQDIQLAIDQAAAGDILLVDPGSYGGFTLDGKSLTIVARVDVSAGQTVEVYGDVLIANLAAGDIAVVQGEAFSINGTVSHALEVRDSLGSVRLQGLELRGACGVGGGAGKSGLFLDHAADVSLVGGKVTGGAVCDYPGNGGHGIEIIASQLALYDTTVLGANGVDDLATLGASGSDGGSACVVWDGFLFGSRASFQGGDGGSGTDGFGDCATGGIEPGSGGDGGHGVWLADPLANVRLLESLHDGGVGGPMGAGPSCGAAAGQSGLPELVTPGATWVEDPGIARITHAPYLSHELGAILFKFEGVVGDKVYLYLSNEAQFLDAPTFSGVTLTKPPYFFRLLMGTVPDTGVLDAGIGISDLGPGIEGVVWQAQTFVRTGAGKRFYGGPSALVVLDSQF